MSEKLNRIQSIDGLRGIAILLVFLFHAYARWPELVPYGNTYGDVALFKAGSLGVNLFFLISGFVILLTLRKCANWGEFLWRRWLRLFPAMLICSLLIYASTFYFTERPAGQPHLISLLPGLVFIFPKFLELLLHLQIPELEGSFWSLYVEVEFYVIFGIAYFVLGERRALIVLAALSCVAILCLLLPQVGVAKAFSAFRFHQFSWFLCGCLAFRFETNPTPANLGALIASALLAPVNMALTYPNTVSVVITSIILIGLFLMSRRSQPLAQILSSRPILFLGFVSYPFYLLHENFLIAAIRKCAAAFPEFPAALWPIPIVCVIILVAWIVATYGEPGLKRLLQKLASLRQRQPVYPG